MSVCTSRAAWILSVCLVAGLALCRSATAVEPVFRYFTAGELLRDVTLDGPARTVALDGREGIQATSVKSRITIPRHTVGHDQGSLTFWIMSLEDLGNVPHLEHLNQTEPNFDLYAILCDTENLRRCKSGGFALVWQSTWWRPLVARFSTRQAPPGHVKGHISPDDFQFHRLAWYQLGLSWDRPAGQFVLYVNGLPLARSNPFTPLDVEPCGPQLFAGNPTLVLSELDFYDAILDAEQFAGLYRAQQTQPDEKIMADLRRTHLGQGLPEFTWQPDERWQEALRLPLNRAEDLEQFYVQGRQEAPRITPEGLLVETGTAAPPHLAADNDDRQQVYLWTRRAFEGDMAVEFRFMPQNRNGLSLVMLQASGMQREDFMADYRLRTTGSMSMVCWENVRNYHWEFFREMDGGRNDVASHLLVKNPWMWGLAYACQPGPIETDRWHRLQFVQEGPRLQGAIDGRVLFDVRDQPLCGTGPVLDSGHFALRCMWKTKILYRDLVIRTRRTDYTTEALDKRQP